MDAIDRKARPWAAPRSTALAAALGTEPAVFPGGHGGFTEDPDGFPTRLRAVLRES